MNVKEDSQKDVLHVAGGVHLGETVKRVKSYTLLFTENKASMSG